MVFTNFGMERVEYSYKMGPHAVITDYVNNNNRNKYNHNNGNTFSIVVIKIIMRYTNHKDIIVVYPISNDAPEEADKGNRKG